MILLSNDLQLWNKSIDEFPVLTSTSIDIKKLALQNTPSEINNFFYASESLTIKNSRWIIYFIVSSDELKQFIKKNQNDMLALFEAERIINENEIFSDKKSLSAFLAKVIKDSAIITIAAAIAGIIILTIFINIMFLKLNKIMRGVNEIQNNNFSYRVKYKSFAKDELDEFAIQFNKMADHIENERLNEIIAVIEGMLPQQRLLLNDMTISSYYKPAREIGGDFYDIIDFGSGKYGFITADVVGKSFPAAYLMILSLTALRILSKKFSGPEYFILELNQFLKDNTPAGKWITASFVFLDTNTMQVSLFNCGNPDILILKEDSVTSFSSNLPMIGQLDNFKLEKYLLKLAQSKTNIFEFQKNMLIFCYTDGLEESAAADNSGSSLSQLLSGFNIFTKTDDELKKYIINNVKTPYISDDITFLFLKR